MPRKPKEETIEEMDQGAAHAILGKFLGKDVDAVIELFDEIEDPVVAAAVTVRVCYELDPTQISEFLEMLETEDEDDGSENEDEPPARGGD